jgi:hypothetical protein
MQVMKIIILIGLLITGFVVIHLHLVGVETDKAYNQGFEDGMVSISPDYCLKEFSRNDKKKFRYIQRQYCKGISK